MIKKEAKREFVSKMCKKLSLLKFYVKFSKVLSINLILLTEFVTPKYLKKQKDLKMFFNSNKMTSFYLTVCLNR